jgi:ribosomal protein L37AE/L43A
MKILEFSKKYPDELSCKVAFKAERESSGVKCKKCGNTSHYWKKNREQWECKKCNHRTTLRSGTVMENSKLPYLDWFLAMHLLTATKKSFSAKEVQRQLGRKRYEPVWAMLHKIRSVMGLREDEYILYGESELDDGSFETISIKNKSEKLKRGRGSQKQSTVLVAAESFPMNGNGPLNSKGNKRFSKDRKLRYIKMKVINSYKKELTTATTSKMILKKSKILTDGSNSFNGLSVDYEHFPEVSFKEEASKKLPWVHTAISNAKRLLLDVHHKIDEDFLQNYLNEYTYKLNRRYYEDLFPRLLTVAAKYRWNYLGERYG